MNAQTTTSSHLTQAVRLMAGSVVVSGLLHAAPGNGNGNGNTTPPPAVPYVENLNCLIPGITTDLSVLGQVTSNEAFVERRGNLFISGSFDTAGIVINSITVNSSTSLTLNISVAADVALGNSKLTITNPDGQSATSIDAVTCVTDVPKITAAEVMPTPPSVVDDIKANVTELVNNDTTYPVTYEYQWHEDGIAIPYTTDELPASSTVQGRSYHCQITPVKNGNIRGNAVHTPAALVSADADNNGIHDAWETTLLSGVGSDPNSDADGDGLTARQEYLFGLDPNDASSNRPIVSGLNPSTGEFQYSRPVQKIDGINYSVETSTDLITWTQDIGATQSLNSANANSEIITVGVSPSLISSNSRLFVRISAN